MPDSFSNEFIAFYLHDERQSEGQLAHAAERIEQHTPYRVCDLWLSPRRVGILNLCAVPAESSERSLWARLKHDWLARRPETNRLRVREELAILQTGYSTTPERGFERSLREEGSVCTAPTLAAWWRSAWRASAVPRRSGCSPGRPGRAYARSPRPKAQKGWCWGRARGWYTR